MAEKVDTSTHYIGMIETKNKFPSPEMLERIAFALGIDTIDLFSTAVDPTQTIIMCREAALKDIRGIIDEKLRELETDP